MFKQIAFISIASLLVAFWYVSPIFKPFPKPTGAYAVGTTVIEFTDINRKETFSENPEDKRTVVAHIFYPVFIDPGLPARQAPADRPTDITQNYEKYPYLGKKMPYYQKFVASYYQVPEFVAKLFVRGIDTHSVINVPVAQEQSTYPVILFSHGLLGFPSDTHLVILENLPSHGYIVVAIDHSYLNALTLFADGRITSSISLSEQFNRMSQKEQKEFQTKGIDIYKADMKFVNDELEKLNENPHSIFYHSMNLNQIAAMGHSAGGTASIEFCRTDMRCNAAIDLDGWYDQAIGQEPINKPLLLMFGSKSLEVSEPTPEYLKRKELTREQYFEREKNIAEHRKKLCSVPHCSFVVIPDATHGDFGDDMFLKWPFRSWNAVEPYKTMTFINSSLVGFLDRYLKQSQ